MSLTGTLSPEEVMHNFFTEDGTTNFTDGGSDTLKNYGSTQTLSRPENLEGLNDGPEVPDPTENDPEAEDAEGALEPDDEPSTGETRSGIELIQDRHSDVQGEWKENAIQAPEAWWKNGDIVDANGKSNRENISEMPGTTEGMLNYHDQLVAHFANSMEPYFSEDVVKTETGEILQVTVMWIDAENVFREHSASIEMILPPLEDEEPEPEPEDTADEDDSEDFNTHNEDGGYVEAPMVIDMNAFLRAKAVEAVAEDTEEARVSEVVTQELVNVAPVREAPILTPNMQQPEPQMIRSFYVAAQVSEVPVAAPPMESPIGSLDSMEFDRSMSPQVSTAVPSVSSGPSAPRGIEGGISMEEYQTETLPANENSEDLSTVELESATSEVIVSSESPAQEPIQKTETASKFEASSIELPLLIPESAPLDEIKQSEVVDTEDSVVPILVVQNSTETKPIIQVIATEPELATVSITDKDLDDSPKMSAAKIPPTPLPVRENPITPDVPDTSGAPIVAETESPEILSSAEISTPIDSGIDPVINLAYEAQRTPSAPTPVVTELPRVEAQEIGQKEIKDAANSVQTPDVIEAIAPIDTTQFDQRVSSQYSNNVREFVSYTQMIREAGLLSRARTSIEGESILQFEKPRTAPSAVSFVPDEPEKSTNQVRTYAFEENGIRMSIVA